MCSSNTTAELKQIQKSAHIPDVSTWVYIDPRKWRTPGSYIYQIAGALRGRSTDLNLEYIDKIHQLPAIKTRGKLRFPVNVVFKNSVARNKSLEGMYRTSKRDRWPPLIVQYCTNGFPKLSQNVSCLAKILRELKHEGKIESYSLNNFMAIPHHDKVAPLYSISIPNAKSRTIHEDSYTNKLFYDGLLVEKGTGTNSEEYRLLREAILKHIEDENWGENQPPYVHVDCKICEDRDPGYKKLTRTDMTLDDCTLKTPPWKKKNPTPHSNAKGKRKANILPLPQKNVHEKAEIGKQKSGTLNSSKQNGFNTPRPSFQKVGNNIGRTMPDFSIPPPSTVRNFNTPTTHFYSNALPRRQIFLPPMTSYITPRRISPSDWRPISTSPKYVNL